MQIEHLALLSESVNLHTVPDVERRLAVCLHWTFLTHVLPESPNVQLLESYARECGLVEIATIFSEQFLASSKEGKASMLFSEFADILPRDRAALEYINSMTGAKQFSIP